MIHRQRTWLATLGTETRVLELSTQVILVIKLNAPQPNVRSIRERSFGERSVADWLWDLKSRSNRTGYYRLTKPLEIAIWSFKQLPTVTAQKLSDLAVSHNINARSTVLKVHKWCKLEMLVSSEVDNKYRSEPALKNWSITKFARKDLLIWYKELSKCCDKIDSLRYATASRPRNRLCLSDSCHCHKWPRVPLTNINIDHGHSFECIVSSVTSWIPYV